MNLFFAQGTRILSLNPCLNTFRMEDMFYVTWQLAYNRRILKFLLTNCTLLLMYGLLSQFLTIKTVVFSLIIPSFSNTVERVSSWLFHLILVFKRRNVCIEESIISTWLDFILKLYEAISALLIGGQRSMATLFFIKIFLFS